MRRKVIYSIFWNIYMLKRWHSKKKPNSAVMDALVKEAPIILQPGMNYYDFF